jgi:molecular chaperone GrpE
MDNLNGNTPVSIDIEYDDGDGRSEMNKDVFQREARENGDYLETLQRLKAEFDNYRKRTEKEKLELSRYVEGELIRKFLPILDDFERLLEAKTEDGQLREGYRLIYENLNSLFVELGLESFAERGDDFDPNRHEAVAVAHVLPENENKIMSILQKGYIFKNKVLRPAKVEVGLSNQEESTILRQ